MVDTIIDFSKHLLLTLIAILAFTAAIGVNAKLFLTSILLIIAIVFVMVSAFFCYKTFEVVIDSKMKHESHKNNDKQKNKAPLTDKEQKSLFRLIRCQFFTSLLSLLLIGAMVVFETIGFKHDSGLCTSIASNELCERTYGYKSLPPETRSKPQSKTVDALLLNLLAKMKAI